MSTIAATNGSIGSPSATSAPAIPAVGYPRYIGGERNGPPEDCGGILGFHDLLEALADPIHPDHADATEWPTITIPT
jgi:hypothetical protein